MILLSTLYFLWTICKDSRLKRFIQEKIKVAKEEKRKEEEKRKDVRNTSNDRRETGISAHSPSAPCVFLDLPIFPPSSHSPSVHSFFLHPLDPPTGLCLRTNAYLHRSHISHQLIQWKVWAPKCSTFPFKYRFLDPKTVHSSKMLHKPCQVRSVSSKKVQ